MKVNLSKCKVKLLFSIVSLIEGMKQALLYLERRRKVVLLNGQSLLLTCKEIILVRQCRGNDKGGGKKDPHTHTNTIVKLAVKNKYYCHGNDQAPYYKIAYLNTTHNNSILNTTQPDYMT